MAVDATYPQDRVQLRNDGNMAVPSGKEINVETGGKVAFNGTDKAAALAAAVAAPVAGVAAGYKIARGEATLDGSNPTSVATGLATVVAGGCAHKTAVAPGDDPVGFTVDYGGAVPAGQLDIHAWKHNGTDPTLVASTNNSAVISWWAIGT